MTYYGGKQQRTIEMAMSINGRYEQRKRKKIEVLTGNYDLNMGQKDLFSE